MTDMNVKGRYCNYFKFHISQIITHQQELGMKNMNPVFKFYLWTSLKQNQQNGII